MGAKAVTVTAVMAILVAVPLILMRRKWKLQRAPHKDDLVIENELRDDVEDFLG